MIRELHEWVRAHRDELLADVNAYVSIETPSDDKESLASGLSWVDGWLHERLGAPASVRDVDGGVHGDIKVYDFAGAGTPVLILAHYDTVWPLGTLSDWPFTVDGDRATGPGIFDMKSGLVHAVWALRALDAAGLPCPAVRLVLNGDEEIGSPASRPVIEEAAAGTSATLVFEASADGAVKTARKGVGLFRVRATGVESHAGLDPAKGASAIDELARAILTLHGLSDPAAGTTVNVGVITGGTRQNVIAGAASGEIDVRVSSAAEASRIDAGLAALTAHDPRATVTVEGGWNRPVMERSDAIAELYGLARSSAAELGVALEECSVGGASDGNFVAALGHPVLDGFGAVGDGAHARHEHISVAGMLERTALAAAVLHKLGSA
ncbi:M20 family metallopeptidase [Amycolatopsis sp., V23-08]|uniref:M20 family metallopeptidase n=1 Tax=Amycolatopsis heterodermiae TaxID=3110235 RepID=A0ABU5R9E8_9PSEU|nr:M20 family metallopeptidase [Amycolatopsis sp., V23-08]MEA5362866.1 M20 family metallopeptidase [Amycolatopsis sp., V23-08]